MIVRRAARALATAAMSLALAARGLVPTAAVAAERPNILLCVADDWGWPDAGAYGDPVARTPAFDRVAREGALFTHAFVTAPSCTPSRNSILTGQWPWRLGAGVNLWSSLAPEHAVYPDLLAEAGYAVGHSSKAWGPGDWRALGRSTDPAGPPFRDFAGFLDRRPADRPFCFWLGSTDPHRPYERGSGARAGLDPAQVRVPSDLQDCDVVRNDLADYLLEVRRFDEQVGAALDLLERAGVLEDTIVVVTGDHGMPFPRHKCHLYDSGTRVPMAVRWGRRVKPGRTIDDLVSLADLAPTFLEIAGVAVPPAMTGRSLVDVLRADGSGQIDDAREFVLLARERHTPAQEKPGMGGYPMRAIRTRDHLYIRNLAPDRWPSGSPAGSTKGPPFADCDDGPTKRWLVEHREDPAARRFFDLAFAKRPAEELYDLKDDPDQLVNVAADPARAAVKAELAGRLDRELTASGDPRAAARGAEIEAHPYFGGTDKERRAIR